MSVCKSGGQKSGNCALRSSTGAKRNSIRSRRRQVEQKEMSMGGNGISPGSEKGGGATTSSAQVVLYQRGEKRNRGGVNVGEHGPYAQEWEEARD